MVGKDTFVIGAPSNTCVTKLSRKNHAKTITKPIIAAIIVFRADSTAVLSPPEKIHFKPPQIRKIKATITEITKRIIITPIITLPILALPELHNRAN